MTRGSKREEEETDGSVNPETGQHKRLQGSQWQGTSQLASNENLRAVMHSREKEVVIKIVTRTIININKLGLERWLSS